MDVDDDGEYMNAAAAHVAFLLTVLAASMYWFLRHAQHARDINIHQLHPLPEKNRIGLCRFSAQWNISLAVRRIVIRRVSMSVSVSISQKHVSNLHKIFRTHYLWLWLGPPLTTMHFRFCGWRHVCPYSARQGRVQYGMYSKWLTTGEHRWRSLMSTIALSTARRMICPGDCGTSQFVVLSKRLNRSCWLSAMAPNPTLCSEDDSVWFGVLVS